MSLDIYKHASFFKILLNDFSSKLGIPKEFVRKYGEIILPHIALLENEDGKSWKVNVKRFEDHFCFLNGWPQFVEDNKLSEMDFVVFKLVSPTTFQIEIYGKNGVLKEPSSSPDFMILDPCQTSHQRYNNAKELRKSQIKKENCEDSEDSSNDLCYSSLVKKSHVYYTIVPKEFAMKTGIARKSFVNVQNARGQKWRVMINVEKNDTKICMTRGWKDFRDANKLFVGSQYTFQFDPYSGNLVLKNASPAKRGRGRPRKSDC